MTINVLNQDQIYSILIKMRFDAKQRVFFSVEEEKLERHII